MGVAPAPAVSASTLVHIKHKLFRASYIICDTQPNGVSEMIPVSLTKTRGPNYLASSVQTYRIMLIRQHESAYDAPHLPATVSLSHLRSRARSGNEEVKFM